MEKPRSAALLIKTNEGLQTGVILVELAWKSDKKSTFCETVHNILGTKIMVSAYNPVTPSK